jgi:hypothetical protein
MHDVKIHNLRLSANIYYDYNKEDETAETCRTMRQRQMPIYLHLKEINPSES